MFDEIVVAAAGLTGAREVEGANWLQVEDVPVEPSLLATLDRGEAAAIPLAERLGATLLADDARAREVARGRGLVVIGTLGVLLVAKKKGLLGAIGPIVLRMERRFFAGAGALSIAGAGAGTAVRGRTLVEHKHVVRALCTKLAYHAYGHVRREHTNRRTGE